MWYKLRDLGLDLDPQNINFRGDIKVNKLRPKLTEDVLAPFQSQVIVPGAKGGPGQAKGAPAGKAPVGKPGQPVVIEDLPTEEEKVEVPLDFSKKVEYPLDLADPNINSSL